MSYVMAGYLVVAIVLFAYTVTVMKKANNARAAISASHSFSSTPERAPASDEVNITQREGAR